MTREMEVLEESCNETVSLQGSAEGGGRAAVEAAQLPAVEGVVEALDQQVQAVQLGVCKATEAQQHPPRHTVEAQSNWEPQGSPGE